ncbi:hypothetical protein Hbut_1296 [Hyperthermus butylicus DSM 5456]|uniref:Uncharacterized protein n=1 Tax=Hyperthermus butylicus (strain DSM 5456 / JCM 9403 / PLM1-5) TaxID=415426 RepID=A2BMB5_HYPBU|nr:hypothetical protein Hbut_1296 [Hyperthermus butylicus DSM 5456]
MYSVWVRRGPDRIHYDMLFEDDELRLVYLGEFWERMRPRTGLQQRVDMFIYSLRKKRRRVGEASEPYDIVIRYCDIKSYNISKPSPRRSIAKRAERRPGGQEVEPAKLELVLRNGERIVIEFSPKVYELVKSMVKKYLVPAVERCQHGNNPSLR